MTEQERDVTNGKSRTESVACTHCGSTDTEMISLFGAFHLASQYFCLACGSPFAHARWQPQGPQSPDTDDNVQ